LKDDLTIALNVNYDVAMKYGWFPEVLRIEMEDDKARRPGLYRHKWLGEPNMTEGKIFTDWAIIDEIPHEARLEVGGGDFGFARDKTAFCDIYYYNGGYIIDQIVSRVGLKDTDLANMLLNRPNPNLLYIVDSADSQKVLTLNEMGVTPQGSSSRGRRCQLHQCRYIVRPEPEDQYYQALYRLHQELPELHVADR
jgi:hypothetical protein